MRQATKNLKKKRKEAPAEVFECAATYCQATCVEGEGHQWLQCDHCDTWVCSKRACQKFLLQHEASCDFRQDQ